jgi:microcystin-dependent protein
MALQQIPTSMVAQDAGLVAAHVGAGALSRNNMSADAAIPAGVIWPYAGAAAPSGWLLANGNAVSRTTYASLFTAIGTTYGVGDGSTTFNLPDLTGRTVAGKESAATRLTSAGGGVDGATLGATGGGETHTLTSGQIPAHAHPLNSPNSYFLMRTSGGSVGLTAGSGLADTVSNTSNNTGGGSAHPNVQPTIVLNYVIKT